MKRGLASPRVHSALADDTPGAAPTLQCRPAEILEPAGWLAARLSLGAGGGQFRLDLGHQPVVARETKHVVHPGGLAPGHQRLAAKPAVGTQQNPHPWPADPEMADNAGHLFD